MAHADITMLPANYRGSTARRDIYQYGLMFWYQNGQRHRTDGPAAVFASGFKAWYINGVELTEDEFIQAVKLL